MNEINGTQPPHDMASGLEELLDFLPGVIVQGHYSVDGPMSFLYVSRGAFEVFGITREQLLADSQLFFAICHPEDLVALKESIRIAVSTQTDWRHSWRICHHNRPDRWVRVSSRHLRALTDGSAIRVSSFIDITREKELEGELRKSMQEAERANNAKSAFFANMSHEMRTPLNGILGYAQLISHQQQLTDENVNNLKALGQCAHHLLSVINDVLDMARIESGRLSLQIVSVIVPQLLSDVYSVIVPLASNHQLTFQLSCADDVPNAILSDSTRLRQILINLLNNAVKFTDHGKIALHVSVREDGLLFEVTDTGCGIDKDQLDTIFQPFERLKRHQNIEGTGLGLAITHHLVQALHGTLSVQSRQGCGSKFVVYLPYQQADSNEPPTKDCETLPLPFLTMVSKPEEKPASKAASVSLPAHLQPIFKDATEVGDIELLRMLVEQYLNTPQYAVLRDELLQALHNLNISRIHQLVLT